ncbi:NAD(P)/FAD-dependent oxidoreductase [Pontibacter sp. E15-1]|uniref:dihydrolipoyl dehydrogenase family protein n=1 Tax=Pontibacter sp. E15-1 TaxID=2919918 RepID=UPI001F4FBF5B|nr:NAD(P)/FAD-dependent oxidoreductase [Pontibacter sp. E15-1]MCJ8163218.1 NAD(P)/FAD-dependent oxidoreductase [Pontibacter sp. E15-1]
MRKYDVFVIGAGMAGAAVAKKCASKGLKTAISDYRPYGGTCALRGCDPKKVLVDAANLHEKTRLHLGKGLDGDSSINWQALMAFKNTFTDPVPEKMEKGFGKAGIDTYHCPISFVDEKTLQAGDEQISAEKIVVVTGARPRQLDIAGKEHTITSDDFLNLDKLPRHITFLGGGYISFEFAHLVARAGISVTIIDHGAHALKHFEQDMVKHVLRVSKEAGIDVKLNTAAREIKAQGKGYALTLVNGGDEQTLETGLVVRAIGRVPETEQLALDKGNVTHSKKGIAVNEFLQSTSNPRVYAAGDVADTAGLPLTPIAVYEGHVLASNVVKGNNRKLNYSEIPTVVFTIPALASVGLTEEQAIAQDLNFKVSTGDATKWYNGRRTQAKAYAYKVLTDKENNTIIGAHLVGPHAEETINLFALAMKGGMQARDIQSFPFSYPTMGSDVAYMV